MMTSPSSEWTEWPVVFGCEAEQLFGLLHAAVGDVGVVIVVGGPQYRAGSHRQFVQVARALAAAGHPVLRFDVRGMGDSSGPQRSFEDVTPDIGAAIDTLFAQQPQLRGVLLWGLCDGASAALLYLHDRSDPRVIGLCLLNPWVRSAQSLARARVKHYYWERLRQPGFWRKFLRGGVGLRAAADLLQQAVAAREGASPGGLRAAGFQGRMLAAWQRFRHPVLLVLSDRDITAREFAEHARQNPGWHLDQPSTRLQVHWIEQADHTFATASAHATIVCLIRQWVDRLSIAARAGSSSRSCRLESHENHAQLGQ